MKKKDLIYQISEKCGLTIKDTELVFDAFVETVHDNVKRHNDVSIPTIGTITVKRRPERTGRNPKTGESVTIASKFQPRIKLASTLKHLAN